MNKTLHLKLYCLLMLISFFGKAQTFNCYISNDHLVSSTIYEFDENIISTGSTFNIRSIQNCFIFNPAFINPSATITVTLVTGSSQLNSYNIGAISWSASGNGFQTTTNTGGSCATGTLINNLNPVRIATFRIESSLPFNCAPANPQMVKPGDPSPTGLILKMAVSKWNTIDCSVTQATNITSNGTFTQKVPLTLYDSVQNMAPVISSQPHNGSACNAGLVTFSVGVTGNTGISSPVTYQWLENGVPVANGSTANGTYAGGTTATFTITNPGISLTGHQFVCIVSQCNSDTTIAVTITASANDNNACTTDACDPVTGMVTNTPANTDDANACTVDACDPATGTISHNPVVTDDGDGCTTDGCNPTTGIFHNFVNTNDNDPCTVDACDNATGTITHNPVITNDTNACTVDGCDPLSGPFHTQVNTNDNNLCTADACDPSSGNITHTPLIVDDNNACTTDGCDTVTGVFHNPVMIDDGDACTLDHCNITTGAINHVPLPTDDNNACTTDGCDIVTGVFHTMINISDGNSCTLDACDTLNGTVTHTSITSSSPALSVSNQCGYSVLTATGFTGSLLWSTNDTTPTVNVTQPGSYSVTQTILGCTSPPGLISAAPLALPVVSLGNDTVVQDPSYTLDAGPGFLSYLWSNNATTQSITVQSSGWVWVTVTNSNCPATDSVFVDFYLGINSPLAGSLSLYPNPNNGNFIITSNRDIRNAMLEIYDATGSKVYAINKSFIASKQIVDLNLELTSGIYLLRVVSNSGNFQQALIIE